LSPARAGARAPLFLREPARGCVAHTLKPGRLLPHATAPAPRPCPRHRWIAAGAFYTFVRNHNDVRRRREGGARGLGPASRARPCARAAAATPALDSSLTWPSHGLLLPRPHAPAQLLGAPQELYRWPSVASTARAALSARYRLLPYLYSSHAAASVWGGSVAKPLFFADPGEARARPPAGCTAEGRPAAGLRLGSQVRSPLRAARRSTAELTPPPPAPQTLRNPADAAARAVASQWLLGWSLLVSPALQQGAESVEAYFPAGAWYALDTLVDTSLGAPAPPAAAGAGGGSSGGGSGGGSNATSGSATAVSSSSSGGGSRNATTPSGSSGGNATAPGPPDRAAALPEKEAAFVADDDGPTQNATADAAANATAAPDAAAANATADATTVAAPTLAAANVTAPKAAAAPLAAAPNAVRGPGRLTLPAPLGGPPPLHVRGGGVLPLQRAAATTAAARRSPVTLLLALQRPGGPPNGTEGVPPYCLERAAARRPVPGARIACGILYADDGSSPDVPAPGSALVWLTSAAAGDGAWGDLKAEVSRAPARGGSSSGGGGGGSGNGTAAKDAAEGLFVEEVVIAGLPRTARVAVAVPVPPPPAAAAAAAKAGGGGGSGNATSGAAAPAAAPANGTAAASEDASSGGEEEEDPAAADPQEEDDGAASEDDPAADDDSAADDGSAAEESSGAGADASDEDTTARRRRRRQRRRLLGERRAAAPRAVRRELARATPAAARAGAAGAAAANATDGTSSSNSNSSSNSSSGGAFMPLLGPPAGSGGFEVSIASADGTAPRPLPVGQVEWDPVAGVLRARGLRLPVGEGFLLRWQRAGSGVSSGGASGNSTSSTGGGSG
jgi:hypothetical protein